MGQRGPGWPSPVAPIQSKDGSLLPGERVASTPLGQDLLLSGKWVGRGRRPEGQGGARALLLGGAESRAWGREAGWGPWGRKKEKTHLLEAEEGKNWSEASTKARRSPWGSQVGLGAKPQLCLNAAPPL